VVFLAGIAGMDRGSGKSTGVIYRAQAQAVGIQ
jgi:hypothetical protein